MRDNSKDLTLERNYIQSDSSYRNTDRSRPGSIPASASPRTSMPSTALHVRPLPSTTTGSSSPPPTTPSSPVSGAPIGRAAVPCPTSSRRCSANASTVPIVTRYMQSSPSSNSTPLSPLPSTPSPDATVLIGSQSRCSNRSARSSRPGQESWGTSTANYLSRDILVDSYYLVALHRRLHPLGLGRRVGDIKRPFCDVRYPPSTSLTRSTASNSRPSSPTMALRWPRPGTSRATPWNGCSIHKAPLHIIGPRPTGR